MAATEAESSYWAQQASGAGEWQQQGAVAKCPPSHRVCPLCESVNEPSVCATCVNCMLEERQNALDTLRARRLLVRQQLEEALRKRERFSARQLRQHETENRRRWLRARLRHERTLHEAERLRTEQLRLSIGAKSARLQHAQSVLGKCWRDMAEGGGVASMTPQQAAVAEKLSFLTVLCDTLRMRAKACLRLVHEVFPLKLAMEVVSGVASPSPHMNCGSTTAAAAAAAAAAGGGGDSSISMSSNGNGNGNGDGKGNGMGSGVGGGSGEKLLTRVRICGLRLPCSDDDLVALPALEISTALGYLLQFMDLASKYLCFPLLHCSGFGASMSQLWQRSSYWSPLPLSSSELFPLYVSPDTAGYDRQLVSPSSGAVPRACGELDCDTAGTMTAGGDGRSSSSNGGGGFGGSDSLRKGLALLHRSIACMAAAEEAKQVSSGWGLHAASSSGIHKGSDGTRRGAWGGGGGVGTGMGWFQGEGDCEGAGWTCSLSQSSSPWKESVEVGGQATADTVRECEEAEGEWVHAGDDLAGQDDRDCCYTGCSAPPVGGAATPAPPAATAAVGPAADGGVQRRQRLVLASFAVAMSHLISDVRPWRAAAAGASSSSSSALLVSSSLRGRGSGGSGVGGGGSTPATSTVLEGGLLFADGVASNATAITAPHRPGTAGRGAAADCAAAGAAVTAGNSSRRSNHSLTAAGARHSEPDRVAYSIIASMGEECDSKRTLLGSSLVLDYVTAAAIAAPPPLRANAGDSVKATKDGLMVSMTSERPTEQATRRQGSSMSAAALQALPSLLPLAMPSFLRPKHGHGGTRVDGGTNGRWLRQRASSDGRGARVNSCGNVGRMEEEWDVVEQVGLPPPPAESEDVEHWTRAMLLDVSK